MDELESEWENKESSTGKSGWMMRLGRKLLLTGIVMSSAPLVIPSIMVISTIGVVCSVPYGVLLATYACTETLMSRLLPIPSPDAPLLLEYDKAFNGEEEEEELRRGRIEFVDKGYEELDRGGIFREGEYEKYDVAGRAAEREDNGEFMHERPIESFEEVEQINGLQVEQPRDEGDEKCSSDIEKERPVGSENVEEKEEVVRETLPSVENVDVPKKRRKKKSKSKSEGTTKGKGEQSRDNENKQKTAELKNAAVDVVNEESVRNSRGSLERSGKEGTGRDASEGKKGMEKEQRLIEESLAKQPVDDKVIGSLGGLEGSEKKEKEQRLIEESLARQPVDDKVISGLEGSEKDTKTPLDGSVSEQLPEEVCNIVIEFEGDEKNVSNMENKTPFQAEKVDVHISQSTDIEEDKELVKGTRGLLEKIRDEGKTSYADDKPSLQGSSPGVNTEESRPSSSYSVHQEASDSSELPVSMKALEADDVQISADDVIDASSDEAMQCEERIWEQMNALRMIVGYKAARKETCKEELKALYLFTGIDPPASLKDTSCDLAEVDAKLGFLKSVVGVK